MGNQIKTTPEKSFNDEETIKKWMLPGRYLSGTKILKRARKIMRCLPNFLMREAINAILGRFRLPAVAMKHIKTQNLLKLT